MAWRLPRATVAALLLLTAPSPLRAELLLVEEGQPRATIVISAVATDNERLAARELQAYLRKITGAALQLETDATTVAGARILVGDNAHTRALELDTADLGRDGYLIETDGSDLVLLGDTDQGSLNAVYGLLEDHLQVRWFMPGDLGEDILQQETIRLPAVRERRVPEFFAVHGLIWSGHTGGAPDWQRRNRASIGPPRFFFGHNFHNILIETPELREEHPDWFARTASGRSKKSGQLCTSHPDVVAIAVEKAALFFDRLPEATTFSLAPLDGGTGGFCSDWRCQALDEKIGVEPRFLTDRLLYFCNEVAAGLRALDPVKYADKRLGFLAYQNYLAPPEKVIPDEMVTVVMTHMHWNYCDIHAMDDPACPTNVRFASRLAGWQAVSDHVGIYDYLGHNEFYVPWPLWNTTIPQHMAYFAEQGVESFIAESQQNWGTQGMNFYAAAKLAWDTRRDTEALWDDFYRRFYGPASEPMRRYWQGWEESMRNSGMHLWDWMLHGPDRPMIEAERGHLDAAWDALERAEEVGETLDKVRGRLQLAEEGFKHTEMWYRMRRLNAANRGGEAISLGNDMMDHIELTRGSEPQVFIEWLALKHIEEQIRAMGGEPKEILSGTTFPAIPTWDGRFSLPLHSGRFQPLRVETANVRWTGGLAEIPFAMNQRARVWLAVYEKDSPETGRSGPGGAWQRMKPQDRLVYVSPGQIYGSGRHTVTWNGADREELPVPEGDYAFDLIAVNNLDSPTLAGPSARTGFGSNIIDTRFDPPEVWVQEYDRDYAPNKHRAGDVIRGTLGADYLSDPNAWERWSYNDVLDFEGARTMGGLRVDDRDPDVFWTSHYKGEAAGLYKMRILRDEKRWVRDPTFGDNGFAPDREDRLMAVEPWGDIVYGAHWSQVSPPLSTIQLWDKTSGEILREFDVNDVYGNRGPGQLAVNEHGIWLTSHSSASIAHVDHDGEILWVNGNGDVIGDRVSDQNAASQRIAAAAGNNIQIQADASGRAVFFTTSGNDRGAHFSVLGRDGSGLFEVTLPGRVGPFRPDKTWNLRVVDQDGGRYDGIYYGSALGLTGHSWDLPDGRKFGPGMLLHIPFDVGSGQLGPQVTAVLDRHADFPRQFALATPYPNPFNPVAAIRFDVPETARVEIELYNAAGQKVRTLVDRKVPGGSYQVSWDGRDESGRPAASGVYFYRMTAGTFTAVRAATLLK